MAFEDTAEHVVVVLGSHPFPHGNASANRMLTLAMTWQAAGWRPIIVNHHPHATAGASVPETGTVAGIEFVNLPAAGRTRIERLRLRASLVKRLGETVRALGVAPGVTHVVLPSMMFQPRSRRLLAQVLPGATTVVDVVERHDVTQFARRRLDPYYLRHRFTSWYAARRADRVVVISRALAEGPFAARSPLVLPPCVDVEEFRVAAETPRVSTQVRVTYFGSPGAKDDLSMLLKAVPTLSEPDRALLRVTLAGVGLDDLVALPGIDQRTVDEAEDVLEVAGRLSRGEVVDLLRRSHYSFLLRDPDAGVARFGFPSKVPESLAAGCPVIGNLTSDLDAYLVDEWNAVLCADPTAVGVARALVRALASVRDGSYGILSANARATAEQEFRPASWAGELGRWLRH